MTPETWTAHWRPSFPYHADDLSAGPRHGSRAAALKVRHIETNTSGQKNFMVLDLDVPDAEVHVWYLVNQGIVPAPNWITVNLDTGHGHVGYVLANGVNTGPGAPSAPQDYFNDIRKTLCVRMSADAAYSGFLTRNPLAEGVETHWGPAEAYKLNDMHDKLGTLERAPRKLKDKKMEKIDASEGRHQALFVEAATFSHSAWYRHYQDADGQGLGRLTHEAAVIAHALEFNAAENGNDPLPSNEVRSTAKTCARWTWKTFNSEKFSQLQRERASRQQSVMDRQARVQTLRDMAEGGTVMNAAQVIDVYGVSRMTAYSYLREAGLPTNPTADRPDPAQVIKLRDQGMTQKAIGAELGLSVRQVRHALGKAG